MSPRPCPACARAPRARGSERGGLGPFEVRAGITVALCGSCKGLLLDEAALVALAGPGSLER